MKHSRSISSLVARSFCVALITAVLPVYAAVNVTQHHNNPSRDGLHIEPAFTIANSANVTRDTNFTGTIVGNVYAQPLYVEGGPDGIAKVIAVTESNNVYALNATTGAIIWQRNLGTPITSGLPCGNINPLGVTATPVIDVSSRALFINAETTPSAGTFKHLIFSLNVDTGAINSGWPVDVAAVVSGFTSNVQSNRAALGLVGNTVYVPYGGRFGDCGSYKGRVVGVQIDNPAAVTSWATTVTRAGVWGPGGIASDGTNVYVTTGNGNTSGTWGGAEAVIRLQPGPVFSGATADYWAPVNWMTLDSGDTDLGGSGPIMVDVPGATPSALVVAIGKDRNAYVLDRANLGGVSAPLSQSSVSSGTVIGAAATYRTGSGTFVALRPTTGTLTAFKITAAAPPAITTGWSVSSSGRTAPFVTSTDGTNNAIVWAAGSDGRLRGYNGDTGANIFNGGGANDVMSGIRSFNTGIAARGHIYYAADNKVYKFDVPQVPPTPSGAVSRKTHGAAGDFDIPLPLTGTPGIESRSGGATNDYTIVLTFAGNVSVTGDIQAQVTTANAAIGTNGVSNGGVVSVKGNAVTIPLTNVVNGQTVSVTLNGVTDGVGYGNIVIPMTRVTGDVTANGTVNSSDVAQTKAGSGQPVSASNFRADVTATGEINATDLAIVKANAGL